MKVDGGIFVGRNPRTGTSLQVSQLKSWLESSSTSAALFCSYRALFDDMVSGNDETLEIAKEHRSLVPFAVINHLHFDATSDYLTALKKKGAKGYFFAPSLQYGSTRQVSFRAAVQKAGKLGLPIQIGVANPLEFADVFEATRGLQVPVLIRTLLGHGYKLSTDFIAAAKERKNFYFDMASTVQNAGISYLAEKIGAQRLYYSSNAPATIDRSVHLLVEAAPDLSDRDKKQILSGTLSKLFLKKTLPGSVTLSEEVEREIKRPKIDTHWHSDGWDILEPAKGFKALPKYLEAFGYRAACLSSITSLNYDLKQGNARLFDAISDDPRLFGYVVVDPLRVDESIAELNRYFKHPKALGIKTIQDYYDLSLDDPKYYPIFEWATEKSWPVMAHLPGLGNAARRFSKVSFIAAHITADRLPKTLDSQGQPPKNVYFDIAVSHALRAETDLQAVVKKVGADRVLYSADGPLMSPAWTIGKIIDAHFDAATRDKIYLRNALTLFPKLATAIS